MEGDSSFVGTTVYNGVDYSMVYNYQYYMQMNPDLASMFGTNTEEGAARIATRTFVTSTVLILQLMPEIILKVVKPVAGLLQVTSWVYPALPRFQKDQQLTT
ncbi:MAG: hypothetical protein MR799_04330 [Lachnospiraceae bacterium]|nr:hypothetical protein [Lachnospiraceae bacterium]